jgi:hypothetical protein
MRIPKARLDRAVLDHARQRQHMLLRRVASGVANLARGA